MKRGNILTLLLLMIVVSILGLISQEKKDSKGSLAGNLIPNVFADDVAPPSESGSSCGCESGGSSSA